MPSEVASLRAEISTPLQRWRVSVSVATADGKQEIYPKKIKIKSKSEITL